MKPILYRVLTELDYKLPLYLASVGSWTNQLEVDRRKGFQRFQWIQCLSGQGVLEIGGNTITVSRGQGMLLYPGIPHRYRPDIEPWTVRWVDFHGKFAAELLRSLNFHESVVLNVTNPGLLLTRIDDIVSILQNKSNFSSYECSQNIYGLLLDIFRYTSTTDNRSSHQQYEHLVPALHYIESHYSDPITLPELAGQLGVTPQYTCVLFQQTLGVRPFEYINRHRIRKAKELLLQTEAFNIQDIATKVGFGNPSYFIKIFKMNEGITPNAFRKLHQTP